MNLRDKLRSGLVIPAHPLALDNNRELDERRQRALTRYYLAAGAGGIAVGAHTTQFAIRDPEVGLLAPVLKLAAQEACKSAAVKIAGVCGRRNQAMAEARLAAELDYDAALLSLGDLKTESIVELLEHARQVASVLPVVGFYLQPSVGGRVLPFEFWRGFVEIDNVVAIKIAPFNLYARRSTSFAQCRTLDAHVISLFYTGNDDNILLDLLTKFDFGGEPIRIDGGLLE